MKVRSLLRTPSNKKAGCGYHIDRISDLPSGVIGEILAHLPIVDAVRTSILSRKWRYMWVSIPELEFGDQFFKNFENLEDTEIYSIITDLLLLHIGQVYKFTLHISYDRVLRVECLNKWILFLSRSGIKYLELVNRHNNLLQIPYHVFSCKELTYFKLKNFKLSVSPNFCGLESLLVLRLYDIEFDSGALESLISGCPLLEELTISFCSGFECIDVIAPTLKVLHIYSYRVMKSICLKKAKNLIDLTLMSKVKCLKASVSDLIKGLRKIERLVMGRGYIKMLSEDTIPPMLRRSLSSLKYLELNRLNFEERKSLLFIVSLLKSAPDLVELAVQSRNFGVVLDQSMKLECYSCCLSKLKRVNIKVRITFNKISGLEKYCRNAMSLIRFILANSSSLELITFEVGFGKQQTDPPKGLRIPQELSTMERVSQKAQVRFIYKDAVYCCRIIHLLR